MTKKIRVYFLLAANNESPSRYCFRSISSFSNRVLSIFRRTSRAKFTLVFFFWLPLLGFNISCRETTSYFLRVSIKVQTFGWDLKILLLNLLFHPNKNKARNNNLMEEKDKHVPSTLLLVRTSSSATFQRLSFTLVIQKHKDEEKTIGSILSYGRRIE